MGSRPLNLHTFCCFKQGFRLIRDSCFSVRTNRPRRGILLEVESVEILCNIRHGGAIDMVDFRCCGFSAGKNKFCRALTIGRKSNSIYALARHSGMVGGVVPSKVGCKQELLIFEVKRKR